MRKLVSILLTLAVVLGLSLTMAVPVAVGASGYDSTLTLENKDANWSVINDGIQGTLEYISSDALFWYNFSATGLTADTNYSLIYYADKPNRFVNWGGNNPGALIATFETNETGVIAATAGSVNLNMDLPSPPDANIADISYCGAPDNYTTCHGAKIWLVPTEYLPTEWPNDESWMNWNSTIVSNILFETNLIWYDDTDVGSSGSVGLTATVPDIVAISVNPTSINFGTLLPGSTSDVFTITVKNVGTRTVNVDAGVSGSAGDLFFDNLAMRLDSSGGGSTRPWSGIITNLAMDGSTYVQTWLPVPSDYTPSGTETATLVFEATAV